MDSHNKDELGSLMKGLPPVDFCCIYGSTLHPNNTDKSKMVDYILGVTDSMQWHTENLKMNRNHYALWIAYLGGAKMVAEKVGVGVHFNPFVSYNDRLLKYGVVRMNDLVEDILQWKRFYLSGRLQKHLLLLCFSCQPDLQRRTYMLKYAASPVRVNRKSLLMPTMFAEDGDKVRNIVRGQFDFFKTTYKPTLEKYAAKDLLRATSFNWDSPINQDKNLFTTQTLFSLLPSRIRSEIGMKLVDNNTRRQNGPGANEIMINSREEAAARMKKVLRCTVMVSSVRQAASGLVAVGGVNALTYLTSKMHKAWRSLS